MAKDYDRRNLNIDIKKNLHYYLQIIILNIELKVVE
jgi:hypothetical protein